MPSALNILELALPVVCDTFGCADKPIKIIFLPMNEVDSFCNDFGSEESEKDVCKKCSTLGILRDPFAYFFYSLFNENNDIVAIKMNLDTIESLTRVLKSANEDGGKVQETIYLASDAMCDCFDDFHVFQTGEKGDFKDGSWDFEKPPFNERNKVVIVTEQGVSLSCDVLIKDDNEKQLRTVRTCPFSLKNLAEMNSWITKRVGIERK